MQNTTYDIDDSKLGPFLNYCLLGFIGACVFGLPTYVAYIVFGG